MIPEQDEDEQQEHDVTGATTAVVSPNTSASAASPARRSSNSNPSPTTKASSGGGAVDKADQLRRMSMSSDSSQYSIGPKRHRGFGASARIFNENGDLEVGGKKKKKVGGWVGGWRWMCVCVSCQKECGFFYGFFMVF